MYWAEIEQERRWMPIGRDFDLKAPANGVPHQRSEWTG